MLQEAYEAYGDRAAAVCLELTKQFERVQRGPLSELAAAYKDKKVKGEAVIVIEGNGRGKPLEEDDDADSPEA